MGFDKETSGIIHSPVVQDYSLLSALVVLVWDCLICFDDEVLLIWSRRWTPVKCAYLFSRYFGIAVKLLNYVYFLTKVSVIPVSSEVCVGWYAFQMVIFWCLFTSNDLVIMMRVYALHRRSPRIGAYLVLLYLCETILAACIASSVLGSFEFDAACNATLTKKFSAIFGGGVIIVQSIIWSLTFKQREMGDTEIPIVEVVLRDKKWIWGILCATYAVIPASLARQNVIAHIDFSWPMTVFSIVTCRLVLNMQRTPLYSSQERTANILTPNIDIQQSLPNELDRSIAHIRPTNQASFSHASAMSALTIPASYPSSVASRRSGRVSCVNDPENDGPRFSFDSLNSSIVISSRHTGSSIELEEPRRF